MTNRRGNGSKMAAALVLLGLGIAGTAAAQLQMTLQLEQRASLQFEPVFAFVTVRNGANTTFAIDPNDPESSARLSFYIEMRKDDPVRSLTEVSPVIRLNVEPDEEKCVVVDVSRFYNLSQEGRYMIEAVTEWKGQTTRSNREVAEIVRGLELARVSRPVFGADDMIRTFSLRYWFRPSGEVLYLRVDEEPSGLNYGCIRLGSLVRVMKPRVEVDRLGNVFIVHQSTGGTYTRSVLKSYAGGVDFVEQHVFGSEAEAVKGISIADEERLKQAAAKEAEAASKADGQAPAAPEE